ncbi:MAG: VWA domain-containing protein [Pyrinomonadaceae bacterium]|nr:VWA domain-containing protein [Pyrinomonadaceae bacterium]
MNSNISQHVFSACLLFALCLCYSLIVSAQRINDLPPPPPPPQPPIVSPAQNHPIEVDEDDVISVTTSEVLLPVTVRDARGQLVTSLKREDFRVYEDGREQPLSDLALRQVPVDVVLMIDSSSSAASNLDDFRRAALEFAARLAPEDRVSLIKFDDRIELLLDWTQNRLQLERALRRITPGVFTRFNDALSLAAREQFSGASRRHAIVVLTDGIDSGRGRATLNTVFRSLLDAQATLYVIGNTEIERVKKKTELQTLLNASVSVARFNELRIDDLRQALHVLDLSERNLEILTDATGGRFYKPQSFTQLDQVYREVADELRHQYALYYSPLDKNRNGKFRRVSVRTTRADLRAVTRAGYYTKQ